MPPGLAVAGPDLVISTSTWVNAWVMRTVLAVVPPVAVAVPRSSMFVPSLTLGSTVTGIV